MPLLDLGDTWKAPGLGQIPGNVGALVLIKCFTLFLSRKQLRVTDVQVSKEVTLFCFVFFNTKFLKGETLPVRKAMETLH